MKQQCTGMGQSDECNVLLGTLPPLSTIAYLESRCRRTLDRDGMWKSLRLVLNNEVTILKACVQVMRLRSLRGGFAESEYRWTRWRTSNKVVKR